MDTIKQLNQCLSYSSNINVDAKGNFYTMNLVESFFGRVIEWLFGVVGERELKVAKAFRNAVKDLESIKIIQSDEGISSAVDLNLVKDVYNKLSSNHKDFNGQKFEESFNKSNRVMRSLLARHEIRYDINPLTKNQKHSLQELAANWKVKQVYREEDDLSNDDLQILDTISQECPDLVRDVLLAEPKYQSRFFKWHLRDKADHHLFLQFPRLRRDLSESCIERKISRIAKLPKTTVQWKVNSKGLQKKVVPLLIEGKEYDIKDSNKVLQLGQKVSLKVGDIFKSFKKLLKQFGSIDIVEEGGIIHWRTKDFARLNLDTGDWEPINLEGDQWYKRLPVYKTYTDQELKEITNGAYVKGSYGIFIKANRAERSLNPLENHSWSGKIIPIEENVNLYIPKGKYIADFPESVADKLLSIGQTRLGLYSYPDMAEGMTNRQTCAKFYPVTKKQMKAILLKDKEAIKKVREGKEFFQLPTLNCSHEIIDTIGTAVPEIKKELEEAFTIDFDSVEPTGVLGVLHAIFQKMPHDSTRKSLYQSLFWILGGRSGIDLSSQGGPVIEGANKDPLLIDGKLYLPAKLFNKVYT